jgi:DNA-binding transcriptional regulator of glucitol operon
VISGQPPGDGAVGATRGLARARWLSRRALRLHLTLLITVPGCLVAGWFEFTRAQAGNELSWVYVFEWPFFAGFGCYMWWRLLHEDDDSRETRPARKGAAVASPASSPEGAASEKLPDPQLRAWNEYLARLQANDPAGGPPGREQQ